MSGLRARFVGGSLDGKELPDVLGKRYIVAVYRVVDSTCMRIRETYVRRGHNGKFDPANPEGPHPELVFTFELEATEDWPETTKEVALDLDHAGDQPDRLPLRREISVVGKFRVYFNRHGAAPLMWCVAPEDGCWELAVAGVEISAPVAAVYRPKATADEEDGKPSAWFEVTGTLLVIGNCAHIAGSE